MNKEARYVWVVETGIHTTIPYASRYTLIENTPGGGVRVRLRGGMTVLRKQIGRKFFFAEAELKAFFSDFVTTKIASLRRRLAECRKSLKDGISVDVVPSEAPPKHIRLR